MEVNFCRRCGSHVQQTGNGAYKCEQGHHLYYKQYPAAGVLLVNSKQEVLLAVRGIDPGKGYLDTPGGFCNVGETFEEAAHRELREELGLLTDDYDPLAFVADASDSYPYEDEVHPTIHVVFWAHLHDEHKKIAIDDDVAGIEWLPIIGLDTRRIAKHAHSVRAAIAELQKRFTA